MSAEPRTPHVSNYKACPSCGRMLLASLNGQASAHAPGCKVRRSILAKAAYERKLARKQRAAKAATTRRARRGSA